MDKYSTTKALVLLLTGIILTGNISTTRAGSASHVIMSTEWANLSYPALLQPIQVTGTHSLPTWSYKQSAVKILADGTTIQSDTLENYPDHFPFPVHLNISGQGQGAISTTEVTNPTNLDGEQHLWLESNYVDKGLFGSAEGDAFIMRFFQATTSGPVSLSFDYTVDTLLANASDTTYGSFNYSVDLMIGNTNSFLSQIEDGMGIKAAAGLSFVEMVTDGDTQILSDAYPCPPCFIQSSENRTLNISTDVTAGETYWIGLNFEGVASSGINPVPIPGALWLFGAGFAALVGFSKRRQ